jgi:aspartate racemase
LTRRQYLATYVHGDLSMHIGLIGGIGPAATEFYYRGLIDRHARSNTAWDLTIVHADVQEMSRNLANGDAQKQADIFLTLVRRLAAAGAHVAAVTSMGGHFCIGELEAMSPLPIVNAIPEVAAEIRRRKLRTVGIIGTRMVMETRLYNAISSAAAVVPEGKALDEVHKNYVEMATTGRVTDAQRLVFFTAGENLCRDRGAEAVLLGGTDLFLAFQGYDCGFPVLDCADVHVEAIYKKSIGTASRRR